MNPDDWYFGRSDGFSGVVTNRPGGPQNWKDDQSPVGLPGDLIFGKERFYIDTIPSGRLPRVRPANLNPADIYYLADASDVGKPCCQLIPKCSCAEVGVPFWRSAGTMPLWAARLAWRIKTVRVERLISGLHHNEAALRAEGVVLKGSELYPKINTETKLEAEFCRLWDAEHRDALKADEDPWVWVYGLESVSMDALV